MSLVAVVIGVEHKTGVGQPLQQYDALPRFTPLIHRCQHHACGIYQVSAHCLLQPDFNLPNGTGVKPLSRQPAGSIFASKGVVFHTQILLYPRPLIVAVARTRGKARAEKSASAMRKAARNGVWWVLLAWR